MLKMVASILDIHSYSFDHRICNLMWNIKAIYASHSTENLMFILSVYFAFIHHAFYITPCRLTLEHFHTFSDMCTEITPGNTTSVAP